MNIKIDQVIKINKSFGGKPLNLSNLDFDLDMANRQTSRFRKSAYIIRGIVAGYPFDNGNKRTALYFVSKILNGRRCNRIRMALGITNIAKEQVTSIDSIERRIRQWCLKN